MTDPATDRTGRSGSRARATRSPRVTAGLWPRPRGGRRLEAARLRGKRDRPDPARRPPRAFVRGRTDAARRARTVDSPPKEAIEGRQGRNGERDGADRCREHDTARQGHDRKTPSQFRIQQAENEICAVRQNDHRTDAAGCSSPFTVLAVRRPLRGVRGASLLRGPLSPAWVPPPVPDVARRAGDRPRRIGIPTAGVTASCAPRVPSGATRTALSAGDHGWNRCAGLPLKPQVAF